MLVDEKTIKRIVQEVLAGMNRKDCNVPIVTKNHTSLTLDGVSNVVPTWEVVFSCNNPNDETNRAKAKFSIEAPPEKSEDEIKAEVSGILQQQLGKE